MTLTKSKEPRIARGKAAAAQPPVATPKKAIAVESLVLGGSPRVHLLPTEVLERKKALALRRKLAVVLVVVVVAIAGGVGIASVMLVSAQSSMTTAQNQSLTLAHQRTQFASVTQVQADTKAVQASQTLATATEITWQPYIAKVAKTLPDGTTIQAIHASIEPPVTGSAADASTDPLQGTRVATVEVTVNSPQASIAGWLTKLPSLPGFVDAQPKSVNINNSAGGGYTVVVDIHVNKDALSGRFAAATK